MPEGSCRFETGAAYCTVLADGYATHPLSWLFPNVDAEEAAAALAERKLPPDRVLCPYTCLLVETARQVILVDTGAGDVSATAGAVVARLEMHGVRPCNVDTLIITHAHPEHIGGAVDLEGKPVFPNARVLISEREVDFWNGRKADLSGTALPVDQQEEMRASARLALQALRHKLDPVWKETEVAPGVRLIPAPGHTPGHMAVLIESAGERLLHIADAAAHPLHLERTHWENGFDCDRVQALATRQHLLELAAAHNARLMAFHFPFPSVGHVEAAPAGGWLWKPGL